jgi:WD40 repeat protein
MATGKCLYSYKFDSYISAINLCNDVIAIGIWHTFDDFFRMESHLDRMWGRQNKQKKVNPGKLLNTLGNVLSVAITSDNTKIVSGSEDNTIKGSKCVKKLFKFVNAHTSYTYTSAYTYLE